MLAAANERSVPPPRSSLDLAFRFGSGGIRGREVAFLVLAFALHGSLALAVRGAPAVVALPTQVTEVELPPPPPPHAPAPDVTPPEDTKDESTPTAQRAALQPPRAARAGALLSAKDDAPSAKNDELVDFVTDPAGTTYGSGVVARGGTADHGASGATAAGVDSAPPRAAAAPRSDGLVGTANLSRRAALNEVNACAGFYPSEAHADAGAVTLAVVVRADGGVTSASVVVETPAGEGFGKAARACLQKKRFEPSLDLAGTPVASVATIKLRFVR